MDGRRIGPFELKERLGAGGMGIVYLATYLKTGQKAAVKVLPPELSTDPQLVARFSREMKILKKLRHPNIVRYFGGGKADNQQFYAMELLDGGTLEDVLKRKKTLSWEQVLDTARLICKGLEHAHAHGIIHRDLKPANIFLTKTGKLRLGDFGIARDTQATALTAAGRTVGTYAYMAPEQISGKPPVSRKTDLYALGCLMYEMLTGHPPFQADAPAEMLFQHLDMEPPRVSSIVSDCPIWLESVVMRLLEKDPEDRYFDALAVQVALDEVGEKIAEQASVAEKTAVGDLTVKTSVGDRERLQKLLGHKKKKRRKKRVPVYERSWFLGLCLGLLVAGVAWAVWPLSEAELFARAEPLMESENLFDWQTARDKYLHPLLERFPDGSHADQARKYIERIEMYKAERQATKRAERGRDPESEAERLYMDARRYEKFGDRVTALERYRSLVELLRDRPDDRAYVNLARRQIRTIEESAGNDNNDAVEVINTALRRADKLQNDGQVIPAHKVWNSIITLYGSKREFRPQIEYARSRLSGKEPKPLDKSAPQTDNGPSGNGKP